MPTGFDFILGSHPVAVFSWWHVWCQVRLLGPSVLGEAACATWRRDVKHAYDVRDLGPSALLMENALFLLQNPGEGGPEAALLAEVLAELSDDEDDDDDDEDDANGGQGSGGNLPWQHFCGLLRGLPANKGRSVKELLDRAMAAAKSAPEPHSAVIARLNRALSLFRPSSAGAAKAAAVRALDELGDGPAKNNSNNSNKSNSTSAGSGASNGSSSSSTNEEAALEAAITKACSSALSAVRAKSQAAWFAEPVDPDALGIPHYREVVPRPMDLGTVGSRLASGHYAVVAKAAAEAAKAHAEATAASAAASAVASAEAPAGGEDDASAAAAAEDSAAAVESTATNADDASVSTADAPSTDAAVAAPVAPAVVVQTLDSAFASDVKLVFANARAFTPDPMATVHRAANSLEALFDAKFSAVLAKAKNGGSKKPPASAHKKAAPPPPQPSRKSRRSGQGPSDDAAVEAVAVSVVATPAVEVESAPVPMAETEAGPDDTDTTGAEDAADDEVDTAMQEDELDGAEGGDDEEGGEAGDEEEVDEGEDDEEDDEDAQKDEDDLEEEAEDEMEEDAEDGDEDDSGGSAGGGLARAAYSKALAAEAAMLEAPGGPDPVARTNWREGCAAAAAAQGEAPFALHLYALADCARQVLPEVEAEVAAAQLLLNPAAECPSGPVRVATKPLVPLLATSQTSSGGIDAAAKDSTVAVSRGPGRPRSSSSANNNSDDIDVGIQGGHGSDLVWALDAYQWWPARLRRATDAKFATALVARGEVLVVYLGEGEGHTYAVPLDHVAPFTGVDAAAVTAAAAAAAAAAVTGSHSNNGSSSSSSSSGGGDAMELPPLDPHMPVLSASGRSPANRAFKQAIKTAQALLKRHRAASKTASPPPAEVSTAADIAPPVSSA